MSDEKGCREAFEAAFSDRDLTLFGTEAAPIVYQNTITQTLWLGFQAARPAPQVEDLVKALEEIARGVREVAPYQRASAMTNIARAALAAYRSGQ